MKNLPIPSNEAERLEQLRDYQILDTLPESQFDDLTKLAAQICEVPICLITLVEEDRQWFKSNVGLDAEETSREVSFCQYTIMGTELMEVENAEKDSRFAGTPLVTGYPEIRFYAGEPLTDKNGLAMGSLCVIDKTPRKLSDSQKTALHAIAKTIIRLIEYRKSDKEKEVFMEFFEMSHDLLSIADRKGFMISINPSFTKVLGHTLEDLNANSWQSFIHPADVPEMASKLSLLSENEKTVSILSRFKNSAEEWKWLSWQCTLDPSTNLIYSVARDVSESIQLDARLKNEMKAIHNSVLRMEFSVDGEILEVNQGLCKVLGYDAQELLGQSHSEVWFDFGNDLQAYQEFWNNLKEGKVQKGEFKRVGKNNKIVWLKGAYIPVLDFDSKVVRVIKVVYDITSEKQLRTELSLISNIQQGILNGTKHSIIKTDLDGIILSWNQGAVDLLGYEEEEIIGKVSPAIVHDIDEVIARSQELTEELGYPVEPGFETFVVKARELGEADENEWTYVHKDGTRIPVWLSVTALKDEKDELIGYLGIAVDVSEMKKLEKSLQLAKEEAEKSLEAKEIFLANMSHEIRTPLNAIVGFTNLLQEKALDAEDAGYVNAVSVASKNLLRLINDVLDLSKIEDEKIELETKPIQLKQLAADLLNVNSEVARNKNIDLHTSLDPALPDYVLGDSTRLTQILNNLLGNAMKFTSGGKVCLEIKVQNIVDQLATLRFAIRDTGIGIPKDKLDQIFDRFIQAESSTTREFGGTGLGLNIVRKLVALHGGNIEVSSKLGEGSEFFFELKFEIPNKSMVDAEKALQDTSGLKSLNGIRILLAEDNEHNQILATTYIRRNKGIVDVAENGEVALEMIATNRYDMILMDLQMPKKDGFQTTVEIRKNLKLDIPIIACTANSLVGEKKKSLELGMNDYITKPYTEKQLVNTILLYGTGENQGQQDIVVEGERVSFAPPESGFTTSDDIVGILQEMKRAEGEEFVEMMLDLFRKRMPENKEELVTGIEKKDRSILIQKSHLVAGSLGTFGFIHGSNLARKAEELAHRGNSDNYIEAAKELVEYIDNALYEIDR